MIKFRGVARGGAMGAVHPLTDSGGALPPQDFEDKLRGHETEGGWWERHNLRKNGQTIKKKSVKCVTIKY